MVKLDDIKAWAIGERTIGHVLMSVRSGWYYTACNTCGPSFAETKERPKRICRACVKSLPNIKPARNEAHDG